MLGNLKIENIYHFECRGPDGKVKWVEEIKNLVPTVMLNHYIDVVLRNQTQSSSWYVGLIDNSGFSAIAAGDTAGGIGSTNGWSESTAYDEPARQALTLAAASGGSSSNTASKATFTCSTNSTVINGAFIIDNSTKGGTSGVLGGAASFSATKSLDDDDTLTVTVTTTISSS